MRLTKMPIAIYLSFNRLACPASSIHNILMASSGSSIRLAYCHGKQVSASHRNLCVARLFLLMPERLQEEPEGLGFVLRQLC